MPPVSPMLAKPVRSIPPGASYEPKWDGFRTICFRDGDEVELGSRNERPMTRYFPELVAAVTAELPPRCVVDGEIVIATDHGLDFEALQLRLHPAASRVRMLAEQIPASFIAFDLLALDDADYTERPFSERRAEGYSWLADNPLHHIYAAAIVDVAHTVATHHLTAGEPERAAAAAQIDGCVSRCSSRSSADTFSPPRTITSFTLPVTSR